MLSKCALCRTFEVQKPMGFGDLGLRNVTLVEETVLRMARMLCEGFQQGFKT